MKICVTSPRFQALRAIKEEHIKVKHIKYSDFKLQPYLASEIFNSEEVSTLFNMRANTVIGFMKCFPKFYANDIQCKLGYLSDDSINHLV